MAGPKKKQHYVSQFYLNEFADAHHQLYVFDKFERRSYRTQVGNIANERYFYDFPQDDNSDSDGISDADVQISYKYKGDMPNAQVIEDTLSVLEGDYSTAFRDIQQTIADRKPLSLKQKHILSHFIAVQYRRTPEHRRLLMEASEKFVAKLWEKTHTDHPPIRVKFNPKYASLAQAVDMFDPFANTKLIQILMSHIWMIGLNESDTPLYTSDQPVVKMSRRDLQGFGSLGIQITLPLTAKNVLLLCDRREFLPIVLVGYEDSYLPLDSEDVKHYNSLQVLDSYRQIYCPIGDFLFATEFCAEHPAVCTPKQSRIEVS